MVSFKWIAPKPKGTLPYRIGRCAASAADGLVTQKANTRHSDMARYVPLTAEAPKPIGWFGVPLTAERRAGMDITIKYMLRPVARCKEGCS